MDVRVRFAPSPTGFLHIGGARTALFNWLFARHHGGKFILRIEDTDVERSTTEAKDAIIEGLKWLGLNWDEGPFFQSDRFGIYKDRIPELEAKGLIYRCYATPEELEEMRVKKMKGLSKSAYDRRWRDKKPSDWPSDKPYTYRFKMPLDGETVVDDMIQGRVVFKNEELEDFIVVRKDGVPIYNFSVVIDDSDMGITHVIRGVDHLTNTPLQIQLYNAMGLKAPQFGHVGLIHGPDGKKYSKRHGAVAVTDWRDKGFLPEATCNYLARLGWSFGDQEIFTLEELIEKFSTDNIGPSASIMNPDKLLWMNQQYIQTLPAKRVAQSLAEYLKAAGVDAPNDDRLVMVVEQLKTRAKTMLEMAEGAKFFYVRPEKFDEKAANKHLTKEALPLLVEIRDGLAALPAFDAKSIGGLFTAVCEKRQTKLGNLAQPIRVAVAGCAVSPPIYETLEILGKDESLARINAAVAYIEAK